MGKVIAAMALVAVLLAALPIVIVIIQVAFPVIGVLALLAFVPLSIGGAIGYAVTKISKKRKEDE